MPDFDPARSARHVIATERDGLEALHASIGAAFSETVNRLRTLTGRVICAGVGKSGHVARKIAATMASMFCEKVWSPSRFVSVPGVSW